MAREPSPPSFLTKNLTPVQARDLDIEADMREAMAQMPDGTHYRGDPYAPKRNGTTGNPDLPSAQAAKKWVDEFEAQARSEAARLRAVEEALTVAPLGAVARAVSELRFHDAIEFAQGVITKSDALKSIPPHELAAALNGWSLQARTNEGN